MKSNKRYRKSLQDLNGSNFSGQHFLHNKSIIRDVIHYANITKAVLVARRKEKPAVPNSSYARFLAMARYALKVPGASWHIAMHGIFTSPQLKRIARQLSVARESTICMLSERDWGIVFDAMLRYVPPYRWTK